MLQTNPLAPPRPFRPASATGRVTAADRLRVSFVSAEDFDGTGILAGVDPCESRYWWMPELGALAADADGHVRGGVRNALQAAAHAAMGGRTASAG